MRHRRENDDIDSYRTECKSGGGRTFADEERKDVVLRLKDGFLCRLATGLKPRPCSQPHHHHHREAPRRPLWPHPRRQVHGHHPHAVPIPRTLARSGTTGLLGCWLGGTHVREHPCALPPPLPFLPPSLAPLTTHAERVLPLRGWVQAHTVKYAFAGGRYVPQGANK